MIACDRVDIKKLVCDIVQIKFRIMTSIKLTVTCDNFDSWFRPGQVTHQRYSCLANSANCFASHPKSLLLTKR